MIYNRINYKYKNFLNKFFTIQFVKFCIIQILILITAIVLMGGCHGSFMGFAVFYGWLVNPYLDTLNDYFPAMTQIIFFFFTLIILLLTYFQIINRKILQILILLHFIGVIISIYFYEQNLSYISYKVHIIGFVVSLFINYFFWKIFFETIQKVKIEEK